MPSRADHTAKAEANEQLARYLEDGYPDWALTALFYAALHWVDAALDGLDGQSVHPRSHRERDRLVTTNRSLASIERDCFVLKDLSIAARYDVERFYPSDVAYYRERRLEQIRTACRQLLGPP